MGASIRETNQDRLMTLDDAFIEKKTAQSLFNEGNETEALKHYRLAVDIFKAYSGTQPYVETINEIIEKIQSNQKRKSNDG